MTYPSRASSLSAISSFAHVSVNPIMSGSSLSTYNSNSIPFSISIILLTLAYKHFSSLFLVLSISPVLGSFTASSSLQFSLLLAIPFPCRSIPPPSLRFASLCILLPLFDTILFHLLSYHVLLKSSYIFHPHI